MVSQSSHEWVAVLKRCALLQTCY